jgi:hypothetical protein
MSKIQGQQGGCPFVERFQKEGREVSFAIVSEKHNNPERKKSCSVAYLAVKNLDLQSVPCEKLKQYFDEGRLVVITREKGQKRLFVQNRRECDSDLPNFMRFVDKSTSVESPVLQKELLDVIIEELSEDDYDAFYAFCLQTVTDFTESLSEGRKDPAATDSTVSIQSSTLRTMKKDQFTQSMINQMSEIIDRHFKIIREAREDEAEQQKVAEKSYRSKRENIQYEETQTRNRKGQEKKGVAHTESTHHYRTLQEKKNNMMQQNGGLPIIEHIT